MSFYIFVASSWRYRRQVKYFFTKKCWRILKIWYCANQNEIHPVDRASNVIGTDDDDDDE